MSRITALRLHEDQTCEVWVDGQKLVVTDALLVIEDGLAEGDELDAEALSRLRTQASLSEAKQKAFELLGYREYGFWELEARLEERFAPAVAEAAARRAEELGYIDDARYAAMLGRELLGRKGWSVRRAKFEMRQRRLEAELIDETLAEYEDTEAERAQAVLERKYLRKLSDPKGRRSAMAALQRLGFAYDDVKEAFRCVEETLGEETVDEDGIIEEE